MIAINDLVLSNNDMAAVAGGTYSVLPYPLTPVVPYWPLRATQIEYSNKKHEAFAYERSEETTFSFLNIGL